MQKMTADVICDEFQTINLLVKKPGALTFL